LCLNDGVTMLELVAKHILPAALSLLPARMDTPAARQHLLAIGLQESRFKHRRQIGGPAKSFFQFERSGIVGLIRHPATKDHLQSAVEALQYEHEMAMDDIGLHAAIEHNDVLACVLARLNLWWLPEPLALDREGAWRQYLETWRPGKAHPETWTACWERAAEANQAGTH
jgi:hypothetical protein